VLQQDARQFVLLWQEPGVAIADLDDATDRIDGESTGSKRRPFAMEPQLERSAARMRASNSFIPNGFVSRSFCARSTSLANRRTH
jgi:hypothetical protein